MRTIAVALAALAAIVAFVVTPGEVHQAPTGAEWDAFVHDICGEACTADAAAHVANDASAGRILQSTRALGEGEAVLLVPRELILTPHDISPAQDVAPLHGLVLGLLSLLDDASTNVTSSREVAMRRWRCATTIDDGCRIFADA